MVHANKLKVKNFKSYDEEQELSMISSSKIRNVLKQQSFHSPPRTFLTYRQLVSTHMP